MPKTPDQASSCAEVIVPAPDSIVVLLRTTSERGVLVTNLELDAPVRENINAIRNLLKESKVVVGGDADGLNFVAVGTEKGYCEVTPELTRKSLQSLSPEEATDLMRKICRIKIAELTRDIESGDAARSHKEINGSEEVLLAPNEVAKRVAAVRARIQAYQEKLEELES